MVTRAALRDPWRAKAPVARRRLGSSPRLATALWILWAAILWNVVFDQVIVMAGRDYVVAALLAANGSGPYARIDDWMRPAVTRAFWTATAAAVALLVVFLAGLRFARASSRAVQPL